MWLTVKFFLVHSIPWYTNVQVCLAGAYPRVYLYRSKVHEGGQISDQADNRLVCDIVALALLTRMLESEGQF
jgi:hypothetical protein